MNACGEGDEISSSATEPAKQATCGTMMPPPGGSRLPEYSAPESYRNIDDAYAPPLHSADDEHSPSLPGVQRRQSRAASEREARNVRRQSTNPQVNYDLPDTYTNLNEVINVPPVQNPNEEPLHRYESLEHVRRLNREASQHERLERRESLASGHPPITAALEKEQKQTRVSRLATQISTTSYLILFSLLGTLARLGLQALTTYPGTPVIFPSLWPNFAGSLIMGFLTEDRILFSSHASPPASPDRSASPPNHDAAKRAHAALKKTIPLYIGLATGCCGSFTSFSSFIRDLFLALSNDLSPNGPRNGGYSLAAVLAVLITTISASLGALFVGAHLAIALEPITPSLPHGFTRKVLDRAVVPLAFGAWIAAIILCIIPPDRDIEPAKQSWRGAATFALAFAPVGCLLRFYASLRLNGRIATFPLGTFAVNIAGTAVLGMAWDLAHVPLGGVVGCQVLQGLQDGFCGCLTTVSTWVAELATLRRRSAYVYGLMSVGMGLGLLVAIMGGLRWGGEGGFATRMCVYSLE